ncbi:serine O-acetyltransferase [Winogradskyella ouciana]|uniref:serine O-acetyltransferase n=1 Tax=Winogradskyella ouciana TaxID=2608631 RepID=UPI003D2B5505
MRLIFKKNCDISFLSSIGNRLRLPHPLGVVIGAGVRIGNNVTIYQNVTLGSDGKDKKEMTYPTIEDNVVIYADSMVIGNVTIGENSVVGAKTLVNVDVPPNSLAVGVPCKVINKN